ncbi:MAG TPA: PspC domain-containing protein [Acidimicrobiales bacterium]|nr:PspC domain-containing protein [Acidimicrobiales bacterium]
MSYTAPQDPAGADAGPYAQRTLRRSTSDRVIAGVAGGLGHYLGVDPVVVRVGFVVGSLLLAGIGGPVVYLLAWAIVPEEGRASSIASETLGHHPWQH